MTDIFTACDLLRFPGATSSEMLTIPPFCVKPVVNRRPCSST